MSDTISVLAGLNLQSVWRTDILIETLDRRDLCMGSVEPQPVEFAG